MKNKTLMKTLSAFLAVVMVICSAPLSGFVGLELPDWLDFSKLFGVEAAAVTYSGSCGTNVNWSLDTETGVLNITGTGAMSNYSSPSSVPWYSYRSSVKTVNIQKDVTSIGSYAFENCDSLTSVTIPDSVISIGERAFSDCYNFTTVTIPDSVTSISKYAFAWCESLASIKVNSNNENYSSDSYGVLYDKNKTTLIQYPIGNSRETFTIPDSVISIGSNAFDTCDSLTSVTIPDSVTSIGGYAFAYCNRLTSVTILDGVESIGEGAFYDCERLIFVTIPNGVTSIGTGAFYSCDNLTDVYYMGAEEDWNEITIGNYNEDLLNATIHHNCIPEGDILIALTDSDSNVVDEKLIDGDLTEYTFEGIEDGEYTVTVSKANYVTRKYDVVSSDGEVTVEFKLNLLGDIDGNGKVNISDYNAILRHVKKTSALDGYAFDCADIDGNGKIMVTDYNAVLRHVKKTEMLW